MKICDELVSFTFVEIGLRHLISNLHSPLQFKLDDVSYRYWQKNWCEKVMSIYDIGMMTAVEFWEYLFRLGIYLHLLWFDDQFFRLFSYDQFLPLKRYAPSSQCVPLGFWDDLSIHQSNTSHNWGHVAWSSKDVNRLSLQSMPSSSWI
jgi:hypothetical protein